MKATIFKNFTKPVEEKSLILITKDIQEGKYRDEIETIRNLIASGGRNAADKAKKKLLAFTPSATFDDGRQMKHFKAYSSFVILDLDKLTAEQYNDAFATAKANEHTFCCFRSPGGNGLKILVKVNTTEQHHALAYEQVADHYQHLLHVQVDRSGKDITRLCFMSYDPEAFTNLESHTLQVQTLGVQALVSQPTVSGRETRFKHTDDANRAKYAKQYQDAITFTSRKQKFENGHRNNFVYLLACNCNRAGIPITEAELMILAQFSYDDGKEARATIQSAYLNNPADFASLANLAPLQNSKEEDREEINEQLSSAPFIPDHVFDKLPTLLQEGCKAFTDRRERDIFLTGALTILSGCLQSVSGLYDNKVCFANLYCFIIAPAASGKGSLVYSRKLAAVIHNNTLAKSKEEKQQYELQLEQFKSFKSRKGKIDTSSEPRPPEQPKFKVLFIPANSSTAAVMNHLDQNDGIGIICETEADTLGNTFKQDWGGYSDLLRKGFHHETASSSRKTNHEYIEVQRPRLSVALSGTHSQVAALISSAEDGLFSRFIFYVFKSIPTWRDVSPGTGVNLTMHFETLSNRISGIAEVINNTETQFDLTPSQWQQLNLSFARKLNEVSAFTSEDATSTVKRLGLITFRIAMVLAAIRNGEQGIIEPYITCSEEDFSIAMTLADVYLQHALIMFKSLPKSPHASLDNRKRKFFEALPSGRDFPRSEAVSIGESLNIKIRTVGKYLNDLSGVFLSEGAQYGHYRKM